MFDFGLFTRTRIRLTRQAETSECGLACLTMIANYHGLDTDLRMMRKRFAPSRRGTGLRTLIQICNELGFSARAVGLELTEISQLHTPAVLHWDLHHFVVLERTRSGKALIHNPDGRSSWVTLRELSSHFTGVALEVRSSQKFQRSLASGRLRLKNLWDQITGLKRALAQTVILSLVLQCFVLASPYYMQLAIDNALASLDRDLLTTMALGFGLFAAINAVAALLRGFVLLSAGTSVGFGIATNLARRLFRLPIDWFENRATGDILSRFQSILPIQQFLTEGAVASVVDGLLAITTLSVMFFYSPRLACVALAALVLVCLSRLLSFSLERQAAESAIVAGAKEQTLLIESLRGITTLRLFGHETLRHALWQTRRVDAVNADVRKARVSIWQGIVNAFVFGIETVISIWIGVRLVMDSAGFSVGMLYAYMAYKTQFITKSESLVEQCIRFKMLGLHLERLADIAVNAEDRSFGPSEELETELRGGLELRGVSYRYSATDPLVLSEINLSIHPGEHIAITGPSGSGKSTLVKILLGLIEPSKGEFRVDGLPLECFGYRSYHQQASGILQEDSLFAGSIAENIALFADTPDMSRVIEAATAAAIHTEIMQTPMQYETQVSDMGSSLSGGQKQRVILARALYRKPRVLIMDEGTAHLDALNEESVNQAIRALGITRIVVAHRRETIEAAERVLLLVNGQLEEISRKEALCEQ